MTDLSKLMQNAAILEVIDKSADEASSLSAQNSYQAQRIEELERESDKLRGLWDAEFRRAEKAEAENAALRADAERYRQHLKGCWWDCEIETSFAAYELEQRVIDDDWWKQDGAEVDAAIGAARKP